MPRTSRQPLTGETPPRTWRRLGQRHIPSRCVGNTSTDVEKAVVANSPIWLHAKHLHGRGEGRTIHVKQNCATETPPRTWRRLSSNHSRKLCSGNTSTDVEKTGSFSKSKTKVGKHLHGRGEDNHGRYDEAADEETPPRTWRRRTCLQRAAHQVGNTSTDVEKTSALASAI